MENKKSYTNGQMKNILTLADNYAKQHSTCKKTAVGCYLIHEFQWRTVIAKGANCGEVNCKKVGCLREELFGSNSKEHRSTCRCVHSEISALTMVKTMHQEYKLSGATAFVTRYPCLNCTKALVESGIKKIIYGRQFEIEPETKEYLNKHQDVEVIHIEDWNCDKNDTNN